MSQHLPHLKDGIRSMRRGRCREHLKAQAISDVSALASCAEKIQKLMAEKVCKSLEGTGAGLTFSMNSSAVLPHGVFTLDIYFLASTDAAAEESTQLCLKVCQNHFSNLSNFIQGSFACKSHTA